MHCCHSTRHAVNSTGRSAEALSRKKGLMVEALAVQESDYDISKNSNSLGSRPTCSGSLIVFGSVLKLLTMPGRRDISRARVLTNPSFSLAKSPGALKRRPLRASWRSTSNTIRCSSLPVVRSHFTSASENTWSDCFLEDGQRDEVAHKDKKRTCSTPRHL